MSFVIKDFGIYFFSYYYFVNQSLTFIECMNKYLKKQILLAYLTGATACSVFAQYEAAVFDYQSASFNNGQVLKAETNLMISGAIHADVNRVEVTVFKPDGNLSKPLYTNQWKRGDENNATLFQIPFNYYLRGNEKYDFIIQYFKTVTPNEKEALRNALYNATDDFVAQAFYVKRKKSYARNPEKVLIAALNARTNDMLMMYRTNYEKIVCQYSGLISDYVGLITEKRLTSEEVEVIVMYKSDEIGKIAAYLDIYEKRQDRLKKRIHEEIDALLAPELYVCIDTRIVKDCKTERVKGELPAKIGDGSIMLDNNNQHPVVGLTPFVGVSAEINLLMRFGD